MDYERGKAAIMEALLAHGGLQRLVDVGADALGNPVFVCDLAAQVLAMSHARDTDQAFWDDFFPGGKMDPHNAADVGRAGVYARIFSADQPVVGKFDFFPGRFVGARIRSRDEVIGMATLVERAPLGERDGELLVVLCQAIVLEMAWQNARGGTGSALTEIIGSAIEGTLRGSELDLLAQGARLSLPVRSRVLVIELASGHPGILFSFIQGMLESRLPSSPCTVRHGRLVVLLDVSRGEEVPLETIHSCFAGFSVRVGAGMPFATLEGIGESYRQARAAMELARAAGSPATLADYADWRLDDFVLQASRALDLGRFSDPVIEQMRIHDQREGSRLVATLETYLRCAHNAQAAARILGIHKNTMYARLERISTLFDVDLESGETCFSLWLGLRMERVLGMAHEVGSSVVSSA